MAPTADSYADAIEGLVAFINATWALPTTIILEGYPAEIDNDLFPFVWIEHRDLSEFTHPKRRGGERQALSDYTTRIPLSIWYVDKRTGGTTDILALSRGTIEPFKLAVIESTLPIEGVARTVTRVECSGVDYTSRNDLNVYFSDNDISAYAVGVLLDLVIRE